tara:strand:- start:852 stop:1781 length:930 start_codon:yes stop_codon:yes gene_type:complete
MSKSYFISFGNGLFENQLKRISKEAADVKWFDEIIAETPETISEFINEHKEVFSYPRGLGFWLWKPYIILRQLEKMNDGDDLFYCDAGSRILPHREYRFNEYRNYFLNQQPIWASGTHHLLKQFVKRSLLKRLEIEEREDILNSHMVEGGFVMIRKNDESMRFVNQWFDLCIEDNYKYLNDDLHEDQFSDFLDHRHDQSILDSLIKIKGYYWFDEDCYGVGPFFHSRMTDEGPRKYAPDWWRAEPDYDHLKHPFIKEYLESKEDPNWWKNQKDYDPNTMHSEYDYYMYMHRRYANGSRFDADHPNQTKK